MTTDSPVVVLFNSDGYEVNVKPDVAIPAGTTAIISAGTDGTNSRFIRVDSSGRQIVAGAGTPGSQTGGVITIQGDPSGTPVPVSGSISVANPSIGITGAAVPASATQIGGTDGTNLQVPRVFDVDSGAGTQFALGVNLRLSASGGSVEFGTASNPIRIDPTGSTTQPVSGTVTANIGTSGALALDATLTGGTQRTKITDGTNNAAVKAASIAPVASDPALVVAISPNSNISTNADGYVTTAAPSYTNNTFQPLSLTTTGNLRIDGSSVTQPVSAVSLPLPTGAATETTLTGVLTTTAFQARINTFGQKTMANSTPVVLASDQTVIPVSQSGTWTVQPGNTANTTPWLATISQGGNAATVTASNALKVDGSAVTQPVSGTVTANAGTGNFIVIGTASDNSANSTAKLPVLVARANTSAPTWADGNQVPLSVDTSGALRISGGGNASIGLNGSAIPTSSTQIGGSDGTNLQVPRVFDADTGAGTQYVLGVGLRKSASGGSVDFGTATDPIRTDPTGTTTQPVSGTIAATQSGTWTVQPGNTANTTPWLTTISQGGNAATVTASNALKVDGSAVTQPISGTVTAAQATAANLNATVVQATAANLRSQTASESTIATATGTVASLTGGAVTTASPTYTTGQMNPLSLTTTGALRIDGSAVTQPVSGTVTSNQGTANTLANAWSTKITDATNGPVAVKAASTAAVAADPALVVAISPNNTVNTTTQDVTATGTLNALNAAVSIALAGTLGSGMQLNAGTLRGTITAEVSLDGGITWVNAFFDDPATGNKFSTVTFAANNTATALSISGSAGSSHVRVRVSAFTSGTATCNLRASTTFDPSAPFASQDGAIAPTTTAQVGGKDPNGNLQALNVDSFGRLITATTSAGLSGFSDGVVALNVNTLNAVRATTYTEQASNAQRSISSANAADTSAGTGARTVKITYYTSAYVGPNTVTLTLNGTTAVNTGVTDICFIEKIEVLTVGSGGSNAGIITLFAATGAGGGAVGTIAVGANKTFWSHHYVQAGKTCYITGFQCNSNGSQGTSFHIRARLSTANAVEIPVSDSIRPNSTSNGAGSVLRTYGTPIQVAGGARITSFVQPDQAITANYSASFDFYEQ